MASTSGTIILYLYGCLASAIIGDTFGLYLAISIRSLPLLFENSTAYTFPFGPTISETWETVVPEAAPKYNTLAPGTIGQ